VGAFAEGAWLSTYRFRLGAEPAEGRKLRRITLATDDAATQWTSRPNWPG
jgi:hypothetical protein